MSIGDVPRIESSHSPYDNSTICFLYEVWFYTFSLASTVLATPKNRAKDVCVGSSSRRGRGGGYGTCVLPNRVGIGKAVKAPGIYLVLVLFSFLFFRFFA